MRTAPLRFAALVPLAVASFSASAQLHTTNLTDGTGTVGLPAGWNVRDSYHGQVTASNGEMDTVVLGMPWTVLDPAREMPGSGNGIARARTGNLVGALRALVASNGGHLTSLRGRPATGINGAPGAIFMYEFTAGGKTFSAIGYFAALVFPNSGVWSLYSSAVMAPKDRFMKELPTMMAIWHSWHPNGQPPTPGSPAAMVDEVIKGRQDSYEALNHQFQQYIRQ